MCKQLFLCDVISRRHKFITHAFEIFSLFNGIVKGKGRLKKSSSSEQQFDKSDAITFVV